jgi:hypothetical protein
MGRIALSVRQPWAELIVSGSKDVENRTWRTDYRGPLLIHAAKRCTPEDWHEASAFLRARGPALASPVIYGDLQIGGIIGGVDLVDCVRDHQSTWAIAGQWHWVLANPWRCPLMPMRGQLGLFEVPVPAHVDCPPCGLCNRPVVTPWVAAERGSAPENVLWCPACGERFTCTDQAYVDAAWAAWRAWEAMQGRTPLPRIPPATSPTPGRGEGE